MTTHTWMRENVRLSREVVRRFAQLCVVAAREWGLLPVGRTTGEYACFTKRGVPHDWRRIPFYHPDRWADGKGWRCKQCGVYRDNLPTRFTAWAFLIWRVVLFALAANGLLALLLGWR